MRAFSLGLIAVAFLAACREQPKPPVPRPAAEIDGIGPLTSRDGAPAAATEPPAAAGVPQGAPDSLPPGHPPLTGAPVPGVAKADAGASIGGTIDVAPALKEGIRGGALFLIARNAASRQIVAVRRTDDLALPQTFRLSAADAMVPGTPFEGPLDVTVRWSQQGDAMPTAGNIEGTAKGVAVGATGVKVVLSEVRK